MIEVFLTGVGTSIIGNALTNVGQYIGINNYRLRVAQKNELPNITTQVIDYLPSEEVVNFDAYLGKYYQRREKREDIFLTFEKVSTEGEKNVYTKVGCAVIYPLKASAKSKLKNHECNFTALNENDIFLCKHKKPSAYYIGFAWAEDKVMLRGRLMKSILKFIEAYGTEHAAIYARPISQESLKLLKNKGFNLVGSSTNKPELFKLCCNQI